MRYNYVQFFLDNKLLKLSKTTLNNVLLLLAFKCSFSHPGIDKCYSHLEAIRL